MTKREKGLTINGVTAAAGTKKILNGITLRVDPGRIHVIMGPNGGGKSTLSQVILGHPGYRVGSDRGRILLDGMDIGGLPTEKRAKRGLFLAFQSPVAVPGVDVVNLLRAAYAERTGAYSSGRQRKHTAHNPALAGKRTPGGVPLLEFMQTIKAYANDLGISDAFLKRGVNDGFSGGEKKKMEMLQALVLKPKYAIFDEIDTGLDVDALRTVAAGIRLLKKQGAGVLIITHYQRILSHVTPDTVHVLVAGRIVKTGKAALAAKIEKEGYSAYQ